MREQHHSPISSNGTVHLHPTGIDDPSCARRNKEVWNATPPVEKRRLSIRKDNPLPFVNVTAVKRFLSRPEETVFHLRKGTPKLPVPSGKMASSSNVPPPAALVSPQFIFFSHFNPRYFRIKDPYNSLSNSFEDIFGFLKGFSAGSNRGEFRKDPGVIL